MYITVVWNRLHSFLSILDAFLWIFLVLGIGFQGFQLFLLKGFGIGTDGQFWTKGGDVSGGLGGCLWIEMQIGDINVQVLLGKKEFYLKIMR